MKINAIDIRVGNLLEYNKRLWVVLKTMHTQPGKGGAFMQVEMKDIIDHTKNNVRFRSSESVDRVRLEQKDFQILYINGDFIEFMGITDYEQISVPIDIAGEQKVFLKDGMVVTIDFYNESPISISLPDNVVCEVVECEPVVKGQTATSSYKPALLDNGIRVMVPPFVGVNDKIIVKVETLEYLERAK
jgi:elongation factor P